MRGRNARYKRPLVARGYEPDDFGSDDDVRFLIDQFHGSFDNASSRLGTESLAA